MGNEQVSVERQEEDVRHNVVEVRLLGERKDVLQSHPTQRVFKRVERFVNSDLLKKCERDRREGGGGGD